MITVLAIGYDRKLFDEKSAERARMNACANVVGALHLIIFSRKSHGCVHVRDGNLFLYPTDSRSRLGMLSAAYRLGSRIIRAQCADRGAWVISAQDPFEAGLVGYLLRARHGIPLQVQEHGDFFGDVWWRNERMLNRVRFVFGKWLVRHADGVRAVSRRVVRHLAALHVPPERIATRAVTSELAAFRAPGPALQSHDLHVRYPDAEAVVLAVGRLVKEKNFALLIRAFGRVTLEHPTAHLVIVGSGPEEPRIVRLIRQCALSGRVSLVPWTDDIVSYMKSADIFAVSSYREGWGRVIVEAMAAGLPGVVTDVGCVGEVFMHDRHGIVVPVDDARALARALARLIADPALRRQYGEQSARDAVARASTEPAYARAWLGTFTCCVARHD